MGFLKLNRRRLLIVIPLIVAVITAVFLFFFQEPVYGTDGIIRYNNALDPHIFIIYILIAITVSAALVDLAYWLIGWCKRQNVIGWCPGIEKQ